MKHGKLKKGNLAKSARHFFQTAISSGDGRLRIREESHSVEFMVTDGAPFRFEIQNGRLRVGNSRGHDAELRIVADESTFRGLFEGTLTLTEAWFSGRIRFDEIQRKRDAYVWFLPFFRLGRSRTCL